MIRIGVDLGGTKIEAIALGPRGDVLARQRRPTPAGDYEATVSAIVDLVTSIERATGATGSVGIGMPGNVSRATRLVKNANSVWLIGRPFEADLTSALARPIRLANDANCFALSEAVDGAGAGHRVVFGVIVGTGTGGGIVVDGRMIDGINGIAGEWGHNPLPWPMDEERPGPACYCGRHGCIETFLSGPGLARDYRRTTGESLEGAAIAERAERGEPAAEATLERYEHRMARALASVVNLLDPDVIVLGGGVSNLRRLYERVPALWHQFVFSDRVDTRLVPPRYGDASGVRGAAWLWDRSG
jgi:fructokinase